MKLDIRLAETSRAMELYMTAVPGGESRTAGAGDLFEAIADTLRAKGAFICQERVFVAPGELAATQAARASAYGDLAGDAQPNWLAARSATGTMPGVQVYAVRTPTPPRALAWGGRMFNVNGCTWVTASGLSDASAGEAPAQAQAAFDKAEEVLRQAGGDLHCVARTWVFMDRILDWYDQFNRVRSGLFRQRGLLAPGVRGRVPASTGIGVSPADGARCAIDLLAVMGQGELQRHEAAGNQNPANDYGSAFARAAVASTPCGKAVFVSGTAAIDAGGATCCHGDARGQIEMTLQNVLAVLRQFGAGPDDVVQAMAYCATPEIEEEFTSRWANQLDFPWVSMIGDVCRGDLLFEVEATACIGARKVTR